MDTPIPAQETPPPAKVAFWRAFTSPWQIILLPVVGLMAWMRLHAPIRRIGARAFGEGAVADMLGTAVPVLPAAFFVCVILWGYLLWRSHRPASKAPIVTIAVFSALFTLGAVQDIRRGMLAEAAIDCHYPAVLKAAAPNSAQDRLCILLHDAIRKGDTATQETLLGALTPEALEEYAGWLLEHAIRCGQEATALHLISCWQGDIPDSFLETALQFRSPHAVVEGLLARRPQEFEREWQILDTLAFHTDADTLRLVAKHRPQLIQLFREKGFADYLRDIRHLDLDTLKPLTTPQP